MGTKSCAQEEHLLREEFRGRSHSLAQKWATAAKHRASTGSQEHSHPSTDYTERNKRAEHCSPVIFRLKVTNGDEPGPTAHSKLVLQGGPLHKSGCAVNPQDHQGRLPDAILLTPDVGVSVCPTSDDAVALRSPVNTCKGGQ